MSDRAANILGMLIAWIIAIAGIVLFLWLIGRVDEYRNDRAYERMERRADQQLGEKS